MPLRMLPMHSSTGKGVSVDFIENSEPAWHMRMKPWHWPADSVVSAEIQQPAKEESQVREPVGANGYVGYAEI